MWTVANQPYVNFIHFSTENCNKYSNVGNQSKNHPVKLIYVDLSISSFTFELNTPCNMWLTHFKFKINRKRDANRSWKSSTVILTNEACVFSTPFFHLINIWQFLAISLYNVAAVRCVYFSFSRSWNDW